MDEQTPEPTTPIPPTPRKRNRQDQKIENDITLAENILKALAQTPDLLTLFTQHGHDLANIQATLTLQQQALNAYIDREKAIEASQQATAALKAARVEARQAHLDYRTILTPLIKDPIIRNALRLNGRLPDDLQEFITQLLAAYQLNHDTHLNLTSSASYNAAKLQTMITNLHHLNDLNTAQEIARGQATAATQTRDQLHTQLKEQMAQLHALAKVLTRNNPAWQTIFKPR